ncbi:MAG: hypothetical protein H0U69_00530 [Trueperaceae bacterium]|nr:hypothetical protein [Trueperaceae bacterium]
MNISGSYLIIEQLQAFTTAGTLPVDRGCANQPVAWRTGFTLQSSAHHVTIRHSLAFGNTAGIHVGRGAHHNRILHNELRDNVVLSRNTVGGDDDSGAWGIVLNGSDNVIANNRFSNNFAWCSYDYGQEGASIEIYEAQRNLIHHNVSIDDATFIEVGSSRTRASQDNVIAYNTYTTGRPIAEFLVVHAGGSFGPTVRTEAYNNTVYLPHTDRTQGVVCHAGCGPDIMTLRNNVLVVGWKALYADGAFNESNNLYWRPGGRTLVQFFGGSSMSSTSMIVDPGFVNPSLLDFRVQDRSPVINAGTTIPVTFAADANGQPVPQGAAPDIGAHEFQGGFMAARAP